MKVKFMRALKDALFMAVAIAAALGLFLVAIAVINWVFLATGSIALAVFLAWFFLFVWIFVID